MGKINQVNNLINNIPDAGGSAQKPPVQSRYAPKQQEENKSEQKPKATWGEQNKLPIMDDDVPGWAKSEYIPADKAKPDSLSQHQVSHEEQMDQMEELFDQNLAKMRDKPRRPVSHSRDSSDETNDD